MIVVFPYSLKDQEQALRCAKWIKELDGVAALRRHKVLIVRDDRTVQSTADDIREQLDLVFGSTEVLPIATDAWDSWPESCNHMFSLAARHIYRMPFPTHDFWLWMEPDAIPLKKGWLDTLEAEYTSAGKPFMGDLVDVENVPIHMSGVGIYPPNLGELAKYALLAHEIAWDVQAADDIVPRMHETKLIVHNWKHEAFNNKEELDNLLAQHPECVLFHSDKTGSIIRILHDELHKNIYSERGTAQAPNKDEAVQKSVAISPTGASPSNVSASAQKKNAEVLRSVHSDRSTEASSKEGQDHQTGNLHQMQDAHASEGIMRASHGLQQTAGSDVALPKVSLEPSQRGNIYSRVEESGRPHVAHNHEIAGSNPAPATLSIQPDPSVRLSTEGDSVMGGRPDVLSGETGAAPVPVSRSQGVVCDIYIKTYSEDYPWLEYCCKSIAKFARGFRTLDIVYTTGSPLPPFDVATGYDMPIKTYSVGEQPSGYLWQQLLKLEADKYSDAPFFLFIDSDTIFTCPVTPKNYMRDGKIIWMMTPWAKVSTPWQPVVEKFLKKPVAYEFMRRFPMMVPRWLLAELRAFCEREHGMSMSDYVMSQPHREFSEFNCLGAFAYQFYRDEFVWVNTDEVPPEKWPPLTVRQEWSKGGLTPEIKQKFEEILSGDSPEQQTGGRPYGGASGENAVPTNPPITAGAARTNSGSSDPSAQTFQPVDAQDRICTVEDAIAVLAKEADRGWFYKKRLEKRLKEAGALPKWKRPRRKKVDLTGWIPKTGDPEHRRK